MSRWCSLPLPSLQHRLFVFSSLLPPSICCISADNMLHPRLLSNGKGC